MRIANIEAIPLRIPFTHGGRSAGWSGLSWNQLDTVLVKVETDTGLIGYGEAFAYSCARAVVAAIEDMIAPLVVGRDARSPGGLLDELQQKLHLFGRYGITMFALSGLDIALWDLAGKDAGLPLHRLLGGAVRDTVPGYASLFKYADPELVAAKTTAALEDGYQFVKLHETAEAEVRAAREAAGDGVPIMVDTNCPWTPAQAKEMANRLKPYNIAWLEEPIFPPENFAALAALQKECGVPLAAGENACTLYEFAKMFEAGAVTFGQPSVTKVGGIGEFRKVAMLAEISNVTVMPHSPYFGPGFLATLHLLSAMPDETLSERFYVTAEAYLYGSAVDAVDGRFAVPSGPGLGIEPDPTVISDFRVTF